MGRQNAQLLAFNRGEVSKIALARVDVAKLQLATQCQVNWMPLVLGPSMLRPGLPFVGEVLNDNPCQLVDFVYAKTDTSLLELTTGKMRVWIDDALLTRVAVDTAISDPNFVGGGTWTTADTTAGCSASIAGNAATLTASALGGLAQIQQQLTIAGGDQNKEHGLRVVVFNGPVTIRVGSAAGLSDYLSQTTIDTGTHSLPFIPTGAAAFIQIESTDQWSKTLSSCSIEAAGAVALPTPWGASDLSSLRWTQSGDIIYVAAYGQQQHMIQRRGVRPGARGWSVVLYRSGDGPFHEGADADLTLQPVALTGNTTVNASRPFFNEGHAGALLRLFTPGQTNTTLIGAANQFTPPTRITGVLYDRPVVITISGTWVGTWTLQRSLVGPTEGFVDIASGDGGYEGVSVNYTASVSSLTYNDSFTTTTSGQPNGIYNNVIAWYRVGFNPGNYTSGVAVMQCLSLADGRHGICRITDYTSPTQVAVEILESFSSNNPATLWQISDWCAAFGWPTSVGFAEGRLWWLSGGTIPIAGSGSNDYVSFAQEDEFGNGLGDAGAILESFGEGPSDTVSWMLALQRILCGREQSIASIRSSSIDTPLTPTNFAVKDCCQQGAARVPPLKFGKNGMMVQQNGNRVYELSLANAYLSDYNDRDLTRLNLDIGKPGFLDTARAIQPDAMALFPRGDGQLAVLLYDPGDEVEAWWRLMTLGKIERARVLPNWAGGSDDFIYLVVNRTINGVTRRFIEKLAQRSDCLGGGANQQLDCALVYSGAAVSTLQMSWLPNTLISVWADGAAIGTATTDGSGNFTMPDGQTHSNVVAGLAGAVVIGSTNSPLSNNTQPAQTFTSPQGTLTVGAQYNGYPAEVFADIAGTGKPPQHIGSLTVAGGTVTLPNSQVASTIIAYLGYVAPLQSAKLAYAAQGGSALTMKKKVDHVGLILYDTGATALQIGQRMDALDPMPLIEAEQLTPVGTVWSEYDCPPIEVPGGWDTDSRLCLLAQAPNPCMVGGAVVAMTTNG